MDFGSGGNFGGSGVGGAPGAGGPMDIKKIMAMLAAMPGGMAAIPGGGGVKGPSPMDVGKDGYASATGQGAGIATQQAGGGMIMPQIGGAGGGGNPAKGIMSAISPAVMMAAKKYGGGATPPPGMDATANPIDPGLMTAQLGGAGGMAQGLASGAGPTPAPGNLPMGMTGGPDPSLTGFQGAMGGTAGGPMSDPSMFGMGTGGAPPGMPAEGAPGMPQSAGGGPGAGSPFGASPSSAAEAAVTPGASESKGTGFLDWLRKPAFSRDGAKGSDLASLVGLEPGSGGMDRGQMIAQMIAGFANGMGRGMQSGVKGAWLGAGANGVTNAVMGARQQDDQQQRQAIKDRLEYMQLTKGDNKPVVVGDGGALVDPVTHQPLFTNPKEPKEKTGMLAVIDELSGGDPAKRAALMQKYFASETDPSKGQPRVNVSLQQAPMNIDIGGKEQVDAVQKYYGDTFSQMQEADKKAPMQLANNARLSQLLTQIDTGSMAPINQSVKAALKGAGVDLEALGFKDNVGAGEAAQALANQMALNLRDPSQGGGMPGAMSDADRSFLTQMLPGLSTSPEGRKLMLNMNNAIIARNQQVAKMARDYVKDPNHAALDSAFFDQLAEFSAKNPIAPPVMTPEQAEKLAPGTQFLGIDGEVYIR